MQVTELKKGCVYIILEKTAQKSYEIFKEFLKERYSGLVITRTFPKKILEEYSFDLSEIYWLAKMKGNGNEIDPNDLVQLSHKIRIFIEKNQNPVILFDGLEYLITQNNFNTVLKFIQIVNEYVSSSSTIFLLPIIPATFSQNELALLEREVKILNTE